MSAGNDSVGEMWKETKIFPADATLAEVMIWADNGNIARYGHSAKMVILTKPDNKEKAD